MDRQKNWAHDCRKTWLQANFENIDPKFFKRWKAIEQKQGGLHCDKCRFELDDLMSGDEDLDTTMETDELVEALFTKQKSC